MNGIYGSVIVLALIALAMALLVATVILEARYGLS